MHLLRRIGCNPGKGCFHCPFRDCVNTDLSCTREENTMRKAGGLPNGSKKPEKFGHIAQVHVTLISTAKRASHK